MVTLIPSRRARFYLSLGNSSLLRATISSRIFEAPVASVTPSPLWLYDFGEHSKAALRVYKGCFEILGIRLRYYP